MQKNANENLEIMLVHTPSLFKDGNFSLEVLLIEEEELRCNDGGGSWRIRGASVKDRRLLNVFDRIVFEDSRDFRVFTERAGWIFHG